MHKRRILLVLSFTAWIASSSFADPKMLIDTETVSHEHAAQMDSLDHYLNHMHQHDEQSHTVLSSLDVHEHASAVGGPYADELTNLSDDTDNVQKQINSITAQAQAKQDNLERLTESLTIKRSYRELGGEGDITEHLNQSVSVGEAILAVEPIANGRVSSTFGYRSMSGRSEHHSGIDLAAPTGTPIYATGDGVVTRAGWGRGYGNYVEINHGNGLVTRYGHASRIFVSVGDVVDVNQKIAAVGCTGRCTGPHLHYEVLKNGKRQNPATYLALAPKREE